jgi:hypothetical protein
MDYDYNRKAFRSVRATIDAELLVSAYNTCILLELSLKQHLNLCSTSGNGGHNLPYLLQRIGSQHGKYLAVCNVLQKQLGDSLHALFSQGRDGKARSVPSDSYPHIRYLRHESDWPSQRSSDADLRRLNGVLQRITSWLITTVKVDL